MDQGQPPQGQGAPQQQNGGGQDPEAQFKDMVMQVDSALQQITEFLGQVSPEAAAEMQQLNTAYRDIIQAAVSGGGGAQKQRQPQERPMNAGNAEVKPGY